MITKGRPTTARRPKAPLEVRVSVDFRVGEADEDRITMLDRRAVPMVDSVFANRDRIVRAFFQMMIKGGMKSPSVIRELLPAAKLMRRSGE